MEEEKGKFKSLETMMTSGGISRYVRELEIEKEELDDPKTLILDLGSGTKQNFAREMQDLGLKANVISLDPGLALEEDEDLARLSSCAREERLVGRKDSVPGTVAGLGEELPFKDESFHKIFALFSLHNQNHESTQKSLSEIVRVIKPGGTIKVYPIYNIDSQLIENFLSKQKNIEFHFISKQENDKLLFIKKI